MKIGTLFAIFFSKGDLVHNEVVLYRFKSFLKIEIYVVIIQNLNGELIYAWKVGLSREPVNSNLKKMSGYNPGCNMKILQ